MNIPGVDGLIQDIEAPFVLLGIALVIMTVNSRMARHSKSYLLTTRLVLICMFMSFVAMLCALLYQDRAVLIAIWGQNPVFYSLAYVLGGVLVVAMVAALVYWKLRPELWREEHD